MIFIDRSIPVSIAESLKCVRGDIIWLDDYFPANTPDVTWLETAGQKQWLVITRDSRIRKRPNELEMIREAEVGAFVLAQTQTPTRWEYLQIIACTLDHMEKLFHETPRPFVFGCYRDRTFRRLT